MIASIDEAVRSKIKNLQAMPAIPAVVGPLLRALDLPPDQIEMEKVAGLISQDESIVAQCLRVANSALFPGHGSVDSIRSVVMSLGVRRLRDILWTSCLLRFSPASKWPLKPSAFWEHSFGTALVSHQLAKKAGIPEPERAYLCGLLHDIGELVNTMLIPEEFRGAAELAVRENLPLLEAEKITLGFTHCDTGRMLADNWKLPAEIRDVIEYHHSPELAPAPAVLPALVNLADWLCRLRGMGYGYDEMCAVDFHEATAWSILKKSVPQLEQVDIARFTLELDDEAEQVRAFVATTFQS